MATAQVLCLGGRLQTSTCLINAEHAQTASSGTSTELDILWYIEYLTTSNLIWR